MARNRKYIIALCVYSAVLIAAVAAGLLVLRSFLTAYESSRPDNAVEAFMAEKDREFWIDGAQSAISAGFNEFSDLTATVSDYGLDASGEITWRSAGGDDTEKYYDVKMGSSRFARLTLARHEDVGFGLFSWRVSDCSFSPGSDTRVTIAVPEGCRAEINGVAVTAEHLAGKGEIEVEKAHGFDRNPAADIYVVEGLRGPAELKSFGADGTELEPREMGGSEVHFLPEPSYSMCFYAREDASVRVNGVEITGENCVAEGEDIYGGVAVLRYECSGLYCEPEISVSYGGEEAAAAELGIGLCCIPGASARLSDDKLSFISDFIRAYAVFSTNLLNQPYANFSELSRYLLRDTQFYERTADTRENIIWVQSTSITYNSIEAYDYIPMADGSFLCHVDYEITVRYVDSVQEYSTTNVLVIVPDAGGYRVAGMSTEL